MVAAERRSRAWWPSASPPRPAAATRRTRRATTSPTGATAPAAQGGHLTMLAVQDSAALDPFRTSYVAVADEPRMAALYDPMFYIDPKTGKVTPFLGESLTTADNGATWQLKLRQGVQFSDGTPFDAAAVKLNFDTHARRWTPTRCTPVRR
ncbi:ABC transporter substrate-binding protein [Yinghuangia aomiensis]